MRPYIHPSWHPGGNNRNILYGSPAHRLITKGLRASYTSIYCVRTQRKKRIHVWHLSLTHMLAESLTCFTVRRVKKHPDSSLLISQKPGTGLTSRFPPTSVEHNNTWRTTLLTMQSVCSCSEGGSPCSRWVWLGFFFFLFSQREGDGDTPLR